MKNGEYILIIPDKNYPGKLYRNKYAYEHHVVWWKNTGMTIPDNYVIHHKNEIKTDNNFKNLELISISTHSSMHAKEKKIELLICKWCNNPFQRELRHIKSKLKNGQINFYCCRSHQVKHQQYVKWHVSDR